MTQHGGPVGVVLGCMGLGGAWDDPTWSTADLDTAAAAIEAALDAGITVFDHADIYARGKAEAVFGEVLARSADLRGRIVLQSKCGIRLPEGDAPGLYDLRGPVIRQRVQESLERLQTDALDVLLLHRPDPLADPADVAAVLTDLHREGLVRAVGVSNTDAAQIAALQAHLDLPIVVDQLEMGLHRRDFVETGVLVNTPEATGVGFPHGTLEHCRAHGVTLQAWGALAQGRYSGRPSTPDEEATAALVAQLADEHATTRETVVLWWLQRHPARIVPVVGTTRPDRIGACADAARRAPELTHEQWYRLWTTARGHPLP